jgi:putative membrane protein insertion efficiency factor
VSAAARRLPRQLVALGIRGYQVAIAPMLGPACRFEPSCSRYAVEAVERHGALRGSWLAVRRLIRCHPLGGCGVDPVP